ncbi:MAG TPA: quinoprotein relay system zinc metallohydrolase 2 [Steroidobacteraceae bacterium]|nr:quinoprotein relay system zinc metallohydrolase 2 [Steroidobacteraceae bacterium]
MKWRAACGAFAALLGFALGPAARCATFSLPVEEVARGLFVHVGQPLALDAPGHDDIANIGFIVGTRCVAVIDTGGSVRIGRALRSAVAEHTRLPVCYVINTHVHVDHLLGNAAFTGAHVQFVGHALLGDALSRSREFFLNNYAGDLEAPATAAQIVGPDRSVPQGGELELDLGARPLRLHAWPKAHSDCDLTVYDAATGTLWSGDLLFVQRTPALDGSLTGWLAAIDTLTAISVKRVIPGHGAVSNDLRAALAPERQYLQSLLADVRAAIAQGKPLQDAVRDVSPAHSGWLLWDTTHPRNVARAYQELEWE